MANKRNEWEATLKNANADLATYKREIRVLTNDDGFNDVHILIWREDGTHETKFFAENYYNSELDVCIHEAWACARADVAEMSKVPHKVWVLTQESMVDGEIMFNVVLCKTKEKATEVMQKEIRTLLNEGHYTDYKEWPNDFTLEQTENRYFIKDTCDDYYEDLRIEEKEII